MGDDETEVHPAEKETSSKHIGVAYNKKFSKWQAQRRKNNKMFYGGCYEDEDTAARASDNLARKLMSEGERILKLNFPSEKTEVYTEQVETSKYIGVAFVAKRQRWQAQRWDNKDNKQVYNGCNHKDEETAARASDTLARKMMRNGEQNLKLNFSDDDGLRKYKRKRFYGLGMSQTERDLFST